MTESIWETRMALARQAETLKFMNHGTVSIQVDCMIGNDLIPLIVSCDYWTEAPAERETRDRGGNVSEVAYGPEIALGPCTDEHGNPFILRVGEWEKMMELAKIKASE